MLHIPCMYTSLLCSAHMRSSAVFFFIVHLHPIFLDHKKAVFTFNFLCASTAYFLPHTLDRDFFLLYVLPLLHPQFFFMFIPIMAVAAKKVLFFTSLFTIGKKKMFGMGKKNFFFEVVWMMLNASFSSLCMRWEFSFHFFYISNGSTCLNVNMKLVCAATAVE